MKNLTKFQTICLIILLAIIATVADKTICQLYNANQQKHLYPLTTTVTEINNDTVTVEDSNGNLWSFNGVEDWQVNDGCTLIMDSNGTENVTDDKILSETYNGVHESSLSDMTYIDKSSDNSFTLEDKNGKLYILFTDDNGNIQR